MFDFCKLEVYQKAKAFCIMVSKLLASGKFDEPTKDQLRRASFSIMLNIAEGSSRFINKDYTTTLGAGSKAKPYQVY
jgi:four helix bundle protein